MTRAFLILIGSTMGLSQLAPQANAQNDALKAIPNDAFIVLRFSSADQFVGNVKDMLGGIGPIAAAVGDEFEEEFHKEVLNLDGGETAINRETPIYVALFPFFDRGEPFAVFLEVKDADAFRKGLKFGGDDDKLKIEKTDDGFEKFTRGDRSYFLAKRGRYTVYTRDEDVAKLLTPEKTKMNSLADKLPMREQGLFKQGDASILVNIAPVAARYKDDISGALEEANKAIDALPDEQLGTASPEAAKKFYKQMLKMAFDAAFDAQFAVANIQLNAKGAAIDSLLTVKEGSGTDKLLAANPAKDLENLTLLPAGFPIYLGFALENEDLLTQWLKSTYGDDPKNQEALDKALKKMLAAGGKSTVLGYSLPKDDKTGIVAVSIEDAKDADKLLQGRREYMKAMKKMETPFFTQSMDVKENAEKYKGHNIDLVSMTMKLSDNEVAAIMGGLFKRMFGGETLQTRVAKVESLLVQATGNDPSVIRKLLDSFESGEGYAGLKRPVRQDARPAR